MAGLRSSPMSVSKRLLVLAASQTFLKKLPAKTEVHSPLQWSMWDGKLALVDGPSYYDIHGSGLAANTSFDPAQMARHYYVRFAVQDKKRLAPPTKSCLGYEINVSDGSASYWKTEWTIGTPNYGPTSRGTFEKNIEHYLVAVQLKELGIAEIRAVTKLHDSWGYYDVGGDPRLNLKQSEWKKVLRCKKFSDTQNLESDLANAAYELICRRKTSGHPKDEIEEQNLWESIAGIYKTSKKGDRILFILK